MDESAVLKALQMAVDRLRRLALVALDVEESHPLALPEPPTPDQVAAYEQCMTVMTQQVATSHEPLLAKSLRDYRAGFPDRAGSYLQEVVGKLLQEPAYSTVFSPAAQQQLAGYLTDLSQL